MNLAAEDGIRALVGAVAEGQATADLGTHSLLDTQIRISLASCVAAWITLSLVLYNTMKAKRR